MNMAELVPAILTNDVSDFRKKYAELFALSHHYFSKLHVDFADGVFVPNETVMPKDLGFLTASPLTLIAHFMTYYPEKYLRSAEAAGFRWALVHFEAYENKKQLEEVILFGQHLGLKVGLVLNPETKLHNAAEFLAKIKLVQLMGIHPGFQGRAFIPETLEKISELKKLTKDVIIAVDGGVKVGVARKCVEAGADIIVAGSAILRSEDEEAAIEALKADIEI